MRVTSKGVSQLRTPSTDQLTSRLATLEDLLRDAESQVAELYQHEQTIARVKAQGNPDLGRYGRHLNGRSI